MSHTLESLNKELNKMRGKRLGYPECILCSVVETTPGKAELRVMAETDVIAGKDEENHLWKRADPWGFAILFEVQNKLKERGYSCNELRFFMPEPSDREKHRNKPKFEAFKRRLSYLAEVNKGKGISIVLSIGGKEEKLISISDLENRPENEVLYKFEDRGDEDIPGRPEKDFQVYLFGKGLYDTKMKCPKCNDTVYLSGNHLTDTAVQGRGVRTNERLALFGKDFFFEKGKGMGVEREFPTSVFDAEKGKNNRILPPELIDLVTINTRDEIAIIELKFNDGPLEVIAQLLNYALYFYSYKNKLWPLLKEHFSCKKPNCGHYQNCTHLNCKCRSYEIPNPYNIRAYVVSNMFHPRFDDIWPYYSCGPIPMRKIVMGYMTDDNPES